jgi:hypothetical protein
MGTSYGDLGFKYLFMKGLFDTQANVRILKDTRNTSQLFEFLFSSCRCLLYNKLIAWELLFWCLIS